MALMVRCSSCGESYIRPDKVVGMGEAVIHSCRAGSPVIIKSALYERYLESLKQKEKEMEREKLNVIRICIGLGGAPNNAICEISYSDAEASNDGIMSKRREDAINNAQKLWEEMKLVFSPEVRASHAPSPAPSPTPQGQPGASQTGNPKCAHGDRIWKDFTSKKGNKVKGWFCCSTSKDFDTHCEPQYPETK